MASRPSDAVFINQLTWRLAATIAAAAALGAVLLTSKRQSRRVVAGPSVRELVSEPVPDVADLPIGVDLERCIEFCAGHVTSGRSFVVFSHGSCVIVTEPSTNPVVDALHILRECAAPDARFITRSIEEGHYLVTYRHPIFHCVFADEIGSNRARLDREYVRYLSPGERKSVAPGFDPPFHAKLGLVARFRLNQDAAEPVVKKIIRAKPADPAGSVRLEAAAVDSFGAGSAPELPPPDLGGLVSPPPEPTFPTTNEVPVEPLRIVPPYLPGYSPSSAQ